MSSDVGLYKELAVFHALYVLDKVSRDKVMTRTTSDVNSLHHLPAKRQ